MTRRKKSSKKIEDLTINHQKNGKTLTPYQGRKRCYGFYECWKCNRPWESANSWANTSQQCTRCRIDIYPYKQERLKKPEEKDSEDDQIDRNKPHPMDLCEKCNRLGYYCGTQDWDSGDELIFKLSRLNLKGRRKSHKKK
ncbi:hypothetical protein QAD02_015746 [Eretmocerus hayati]|uniref:Uncharacterized protein n=1 Tax=Eretmocerus hayati TaxID=131215 RepID=A0ACC2P8M7_9HYME|nr:hypothetical protein QAD02_015746 [Eretmocerus hayati]